MSNNTSASGGLSDLLSRARLLLLDFDGPVAAIFAGYPATRVADELKALLIERGVAFPKTLASYGDPLDVIRWAGHAAAPHDRRAVEDLLTELERRAVQSAAPTPGADVLLKAAAHIRLRVRIVSINSRESIADYLLAHRLTAYVDGVHGRPNDHPQRMKPNPWTIEEALARAGESASTAVLLGDSVSDVMAARAAHVPCLGYANEPGKETWLREAGATLVIADMTAVAQALVSTGRNST